MRRFRHAPRLATSALALASFLTIGSSSAPALAQVLLHRSTGKVLGARPARLGTREHIYVTPKHEYYERTQWLQGVPGERHGLWLYDLERVIPLATETHHVAADIPGKLLPARVIYTTRTGRHGERHVYAKDVPATLKRILTEGGSAPKVRVGQRGHRWQPRSRGARGAPTRPLH